MVTKHAAPPLPMDRPVHLMEIAAHFRVSPPTVYNWLKHHGFPNRGYGWRDQEFSPTEVMAWAAKHLVNGRIKRG